MQSNRARSFAVLAAVVLVAVALLCALVLRDRWPRPAEGGGVKAPDAEMPVPQETPRGPMRPSSVVMMEFGRIWELRNYRTRDELLLARVAAVDFARSPGQRLAASFVGSGAGVPWAGVGLAVNPVALVQAAEACDTKEHRRRMHVIHGTPWGEGRIDLPGKSERSVLIIVEGSELELAVRFLSFASRLEVAMLNSGAKLIAREVTASPAGLPRVLIRYEIGDRTGTIEAGFSPTEIQMSPKPETVLCLHIKVQEMRK